MIDRARGLVTASAGVALFQAVLLGCATTTGTSVTGLRDTLCVDGSFSGRFSPAETGEPQRRLRIAARSCPAGALHVEVRGAVGGPVLVATVREGLMTLLLPRERRAVEGPAEDRRIWEAETGLPFDGNLLREMLAPGAAGFRGPVGDWRLELVDDAGGRFPDSLVAVHSGGARLTVEKRSERPAEAGLGEPPVPDDFELVSYHR